jgi:hypothetical protein
MFRYPKNLLTEMLKDILRERVVRLMMLTVPRF